MIKSEVLFKNTGRSSKICKVLAEYYDEKKSKGLGRASGEQVKEFR